MDLIRAALYGIVQGLTEWLPISSSAHLRLLPAVMRWKDPGPAFTAVIQLGTMLALILFFRKDLGEALSGWVAGLRDANLRDTKAYRMGWGIFWGTLPIVVLGFAFKDQIEHAFRSLYVVAGMLILMGLVLAAAERFGQRRRGMDEVTVKDGIWVGLWQALAIIPGSSRSGSCISGALFAQFDRESAARFSFLLSIPSVLAAGVYSLVEHRAEFAGDMLMPMLVANAFSFAVGWASLAALMRFLHNHSTAVFVWYRVAIGLAILGAVSMGAIPANGEDTQAMAPAQTHVSP